MQDNELPCTGSLAARLFVPRAAPNACPPQNAQTASCRSRCSKYFAPNAVLVEGPPDHIKIPSGCGLEACLRTQHTFFGVGIPYNLKAAVLRDQFANLRTLHISDPFTNYFARFTVSVEAAG